MKKKLLLGLGVGVVVAGGAICYKKFAPKKKNDQNAIEARYHGFIDEATGCKQEDIDRFYTIDVNISNCSKEYLKFHNAVLINLHRLEDIATVTGLPQHTVNSWLSDLIPTIQGTVMAGLTSEFLYYDGTKTFAELIDKTWNEITDAAMDDGFVVPSNDHDDLFHIDLILNGKTMREIFDAEYAEGVTHEVLFTWVTAYMKAFNDYFNK